MHRAVASILGVAVPLCWLAPSASGNILFNGDFEGTTYNKGNEVLPTGWENLPPNLPSQSNINVVNATAFPGFSDPGGGSFYMAFRSPAQDGSQDCFLQDVATVPGQTYTLSFWAAITLASPYLQLSPDWDSLGSNRTFVAMNGFNSNSGQDHTSSAGPIAFEQFSLQVTASLNLTRLYFHGVDSNGAVLLDNVILTSNAAVPEPASLLLIGSGLVIVGLRRRVKEWLRDHGNVRRIPLRWR